MSRWDEILDDWEKMIARAERAITENKHYDQIVLEPIKIPEGIEKPPARLEKRAADLNQRANVVSEHLTQRGAEVVAELTRLNIKRNGPGRTKPEKRPSMIDSRV